jgi:hypothetical protein
MIATSDYLPVASPVAGEWVAVNTPAERVPSHGTHYFAQTYAFDFARLNKTGTGFSLLGVWRQFLFFVPVEAFLAWNQPVHAAFAGEVIAIGEGCPDRLRVNALCQLFRANLLARRPSPVDLRPLLGNYCLVSGSPGVALYAHLRNGTVAVQPGSRVETGQVIGRVGNSGNSTMPHLHFHVMDGPDPFAAKGVPVSILDYSVLESATYRNVMAGVPRLMQPFLGRPPSPGIARGA